MSQRIDILASIKVLRNLLASFSGKIISSGLEAYSPEVAPYDPDKSVEHDLSRKVIADAVMQLNYEDEQEPNESVSFPGFMYANNEMLDLIDKINKSKTHIKELFKTYSQIQVTQYGKNLMTLDKYILQNTDESRLNKQETYRKLHFAEQENLVKSIGFTWASVPVTKKIIVSKAIKFIARHQLDEQHKNIDIALLETLNKDEVLAHERRAPIKARINVQYDNKALFKKGHKMYTGVMPFFIHESNKLITSVYPLKSRVGMPSGQQRMRTKLEPHPFCKNSPIYRYQPKYREVLSGE